MIRRVTSTLAWGLLALWLVGVITRATTWVTWLDGMAALGAFMVAGDIGRNTDAASVVAGPLMIALGLLVVGVFAATGHAAPWMIVLTFIFTPAFVALAIWAGLRRRARRTEANSD
jgi:hypothetical protein